MPQNKRTYHNKFLEIVEGLTDAPLSEADKRVLRGEARWVRTFLRNKRRAASARVRPGRRKLPDDQVSPDSLKKREYRRKRLLGLA